MTRPTTRTFSRWARWGLLVTTLAMGTALLVTAYSSYSSVQSASELLVRGLAETFVRSVREQARLTRGPPSVEDLRDVLTTHEDAGLTYVALVELDGTVVVEAGTKTRPPQPVESEPVGLTLSTTAELVRVVAKPPARHRRSFWRRWRRRAFRERPAIIVEFRPKTANDLRRGARRTIVSSAVAAAVLMAAALGFWRLMRQREKEQERVERERRLATLGEMSAVLAHEIRNPLASLKGNAQLLVEQLPPDAKGHQKAVRIVGDAERLEKLSSTLLDFVRSGSIERRAVKPADLLRQASAADERVELDVSRAPETWLLDPLRVQEVLTNLVENAIQASPEATKVNVRAFTEGATLVIEVRDHGEGIAPADVDRIFEAFHTKRTKGTGLGLAVARRIVELHGGTISAQNHPGGGALFTVRLPK